MFVKDMLIKKFKLDFSSIDYFVHSEEKLKCNLYLDLPEYEKEEKSINDIVIELKDDIGVIREYDVYLKNRKVIGPSLTKIKTVKVLMTSDIHETVDLYKIKKMFLCAEQIDVVLEEVKR